MHIARPLLSALILLSSIFSLEAENKNYYVTVRDGLSNSSINAIMQDDHGLLWLSTWDGINVYDGRNIRVFKSDPFDDKTLLDNIVRGIVQENSRYYWAITDWGLSRLDLSTMEFTRFRMGNETMTPFSGSGVSMTIADDGQVFCSSRGWGVAVLDRRLDRMDPFNIQNFNTSVVSGIVSLGNGRLLLQTFDGGAAEVRYAVNKLDGTISASLVNYLLPNETGQYFMCDSPGSVYLAGTSSISRYSKEQGTIVDSIPFRGTISYASESEPGRLYVVSDRSRLYCIDFNDHSVTPTDEYSRENLLSFHFGCQGIVWLSVDGLGLEACYSVESTIKRLSSKTSFYPQGGAVTSLVQAESGDIYASVLGRGMYVLDSEGNVKGRARNGKIDGGYIFSMAEGPDGCIVAGVRNAVCLYNPFDGSVIQLKTYDANPAIVFYCIYYDSQRNCIWTGTLDRGVYCMKLKNRGGGYVVSETIRYSHKTDDPSSLSNDNVMHLAPSGRDKLWVGTLGGGLNLLDMESGECQNFTFEISEGGILSDNARFAYEDAPGSVWVGTSYGLSHGIRDERGQWTFNSYSEKDGLLDNTVHSLMMDPGGNIWLSTNRGLSRFNVSSETFTNFDSDEYLQGSEFYIHSCTTTSSGEMYFGGVEGLNHFYPGDVKTREFSPEILIYGLTARLNEVMNLRDRNKVILPYSDNFFNVNFSAVEFLNNSNCSYSYKLEGFNDNWVLVPSGVPATFTNVPPGKYTFRVRSTNGDKVWCDNESSFEIVIRHPWYQTIWAYLLYIITIAGIIAYGRRVVRMRQRHKLELARKNMEKQAQMETYEAKLTFFTNIAHEFGTPLTLISCSGERLASGALNNQKAVRYVKIINDNAARMQKLIQELLEFRRVETGHYDPLWCRFDVGRLMRSILEDFSERGETHRISLELDMPQEALMFVGDKAALEKILINLVSNAYKYTPDGGKVNILLEVDGEGRLHSVVENTSKGLSPEQLKRVFDRFVILDNLEQQMALGKKVRNGVGMALVQSYIRTFGGDISVSSVMSRSVTFEFHIPAGPDECLAEDVQESGQRDDIALSLGEELPVSSEGTEGEKADGRPVIVVVDDDAQICELVFDILDGTYRVLKAGNGQAALELLEKHRVDLVITDIIMPVMNGNQLIARMKENELTRFIPVVFLAVRNDISDEINSYNLGSEAFIPKPFLPAQLIAIVGGILKNRSSLKTYYTSAMSDMEMFNGTPLNSRDKDLMSAIVNAVEERMSEDIAPAELAEILSLSEMTLYRRIKSAVDKTPAEIIREIKLKHAATLLRTTTRTVQEIMFDCGFNNKSWFYRKFAETYNMSPKEFRQSGQNEA